MRVGIVGGGIAALVTAHQIAAAGGQPIIVDKASRIGGRLARTRFAGGVIPTGATSCRLTDDAARQAFAATLNVPFGGDRIAFEDGVWSALDRLNTQVVRQYGLVTRIVPTYTGCSLELWGNANGVPFDAAVITAPVPQGIHLLTRSGLPHTLAASYEARFVLLAAVAKDPDAELPGPWHFLRREPGLITAQPGHQWVVEHFGEDQTQVHSLLLDELHHTFPGLIVTASQLKVWRYANALQPSDRDPGAPVTGTAVWACGDGFGAPGVEYGVQRAVTSALAVSAALKGR